MSRKAGQPVSESIVVYSLLAMALCAISFSMGVWIAGAHEGRNQRVALPRIEQVNTQCQSRLAEIRSLAKHARSLSELCARQKARLPSGVIRRAASVAKRAAKLQTRMETFMATQTPKQLSKPNTGRSEPTPSSLSPGDEQKKDGNSGRTRLTKAWQFVALRQGETLPAADQFAPVLCRNLSSSGFSYFSKELPSADSLIVALGSPPKFRFYLAKITRIGPVSLNGELGHRIDCEFVQKLAQIYQWDQDQSRISVAPTSATTA